MKRVLVIVPFPFDEHGMANRSAQQKEVQLGPDMRRGIVLVMVGFGLMVCFGAWNDWEGGAWAIGVIPFVIGLGYLLVWKLEGGKKNEIPPAPPTP